MNTLTRRLAAAAAAACGLALIPLAAPAPSASASTVLHSANWAGYIVTAPAGRHVGIVSAYWTVPAARPAHSVGKPPYQAAMWVGIDGDSSFGQKYGPFQAGVYETASSKAKAPEYDLFWEMAPDHMQFSWNGHNGKVHVKPGDHILAQVSYGIQPQYPAAYHKFHFVVTVNGQLFETTQKPRAGWRVDRHTVEIISEAPTVGGTTNIPGMLDMGTVTYHHTSYALDSVTNPGWRDSNPWRVTAGYRMELWHGTRQVIRVTAPSTSPGSTGPDRFATAVTGRW
jgi:hypothetical protein